MKQSAAIGLISRLKHILKDVAKERMKNGETEIDDLNQLNGRLNELHEFISKMTVTEVTKISEREDPRKINFKQHTLSF